MFSPRLINRTLDASQKFVGVVSFSQITLDVEELTCSLDIATTWLAIPRRTLQRSCQRCQTVSTRSSRDRRDTGYALLAVPLATFGLGTWQIGRRQWKLNLIHQLEERTGAAPIPFPTDLDELGDLEYRKVVLRGEFDHSRELYVLPRVPVSDEKPSGGLVGSGASSGANVITPFKVADRDLTILVNRGWVPRNCLAPETRKEGQVEGELELVAVVRKTEARKPFAAANDVQRNRWFHRDVEAMATKMDTDPIFVDADSGTTVPGGPIGGQTRVTLRNEHLQYVLTWYSLCAITTFMWVKRYLK